MKLLLLILIYILFSTAGLILLKSSLSIYRLNLMDFGSVFCRLISSPKFLLGAVFYVMSFLTWLIILSEKELSYIFPIITGLGYISIIFASYIFLREEITIFRLMGIILIGLGIILIFRAT